MYQNIAIGTGVLLGVGVLFWIWQRRKTSTTESTPVAPETLYVGLPSSAPTTPTSPKGGQSAGVSNLPQVQNLTTMQAAVLSTAPNKVKTQQ